MKRGAEAKRKVLTGIAAILVGMMTGCIENWRPTWWNFYERGISRTAVDQFQEAAEDFETAVGEKKGATFPRPKDARRVRTYGLHFIDDYFPHRELGVAYYRMARFTDAERELLVSLNETPSAKAKVYLNYVRRELLRQKPVQDEPPALTLEVPDKPYLNSDRIRLTGAAESKNRISSIRVNGQRLFIELAEQKTQFSRDLRLKPGANKVVVEAIDLIGKSLQKELLLNVDVEHPGVGILDAVRKGADSVTISGVATDNVGISQLRIDQEPHAIDRPGPETEFRVEAALGDTVAVQATDLAGNTTSTKVTVSADMLRPTGEGLHPPVLLAMGDSGRVADSGGSSFRVVQAAARDDQQPPVISLPKGIDGRIIYDSQFIFQISARDSGRLAALSVNGEDILEGRTGLLSYGKDYRVALTEGVNRFTVVAVDTAGNRTEKSFQVVMKVQKPLDVDVRWTMALLPLREKGSTRAAMDQIYDLLFRSFWDSRRFNFVVRDEETIETILVEHSISNSQLADPETAIRVGHIVNAEGMLFGTAIEDERSITVNLYLVDAETTKVLFFADVYDEEDKSREGLKWLVDGLVLKFKQQFPLVRGRVTGVAESGVSIDHGLRDGIWSGMKYLVFKEEQGGALQLLKLLSGKNLEARAEVVQPETCFAAFLDRIGLPPVKVGYEVITK